MNFINKYLYKFLLVFLAIIWLIISYSTLMVNYTLDLASIFILLTSILLLFFISTLYMKLTNVKSKTIDKISVILCILYFVISCTFALKYKVDLQWDLDIIADYVNNLLTNNRTLIGNSSYLSIYPHQIPITILIYFIETIGRILSFKEFDFTIIYNCFMISLSYIYIYRTIKLLKNEKAAFITLLLMLFSPCFFLYGCYFYTDILSIPFCIIGFFYILKSEYCIVSPNFYKNKKSIFYLIIGSILLFISFKLRIINLILLISYYIYFIFKYKLKGLKKLSLTIFLFIVLSISYKSIIYNNFNFNINKEKKFPYTHWIMIGCNPNGGKYSEKDYKITDNAKNKVDTNIKIIKKRMKNNNLSFYIKKILFLWSNGNYDINGKYINTSNYDSTYKYLNGSSSIILECTEQIILLTIYMLFVLNIISNILKTNFINQSSIYIIAIFGGFIFYIFWESQARYALTFYPWLAICSSFSIPKLVKLFNTKKLNIKRYTLNLNSFYKIFYVTIFISLIFLLILGYNKCCTKKTIVNDIALAQQYPNKRIPIIKNVIEDEFYVSRSFNTIKLFFYNKSTRKVDYFFELYDSDNNIIYDEKFESEQDYTSLIHIFKIPNQKIKDKKKYKIKIYSKNASNLNYLEILSYSPNEYSKIYDKNYFNVNKLQKLYNNNKSTNAKLMLNVYNAKEDYKISKKMYIFISSITILLSLYPLFNMFKKNVFIK